MDIESVVGIKETTEGGDILWKPCSCKALFETPSKDCMLVKKFSGGVCYG